MAGHRVTPFELYATRKRPRHDEDGEAHLLLAAELVREDDGTLDLLDAIQHNIGDVEPYVTRDGSHTVRCLDVRRRPDRVDLIFACDVEGEREVVRNREEGVVVLIKGPEHVARFYSCVTVWRPADGDTGILLVHSPYGRGGSKSQILALLQRAVNEEEGARAKLHAHPKVPHDVLKMLLRRARSTRIAYRKTKAIRSRFSNTTGLRSAPAEMELVVKGSDSVPYRDALEHALRNASNRDAFYTVQVRDPDGEFHEEVFDDVAISLVSPDGSTKTYSVAQDSVPTMGFDVTEEMIRVFRELPADDDAEWPAELQRRAHRIMTGALDSVI